MTKVYENVTLSNRRLNIKTNNQSYKNNPKHCHRVPDNNKISRSYHRHPKKKSKATYKQLTSQANERDD
jgi:hypothetical protein